MKAIRKLIGREKKEEKIDAKKNDDAKDNGENKGGDNKNDVKVQVQEQKQPPPRPGADPNISILDGSIPLDPRSTRLRKQAAAAQEENDEMNAPEDKVDEELEPEEYGSGGAKSHELFTGGWGALKMVLYILVLAGAGYVGFSDYNKRPCTQSLQYSYCLNSTPNMTCSGYDLNTLCGSNCGTNADGTRPPCSYDPRAPTVIKCWTSSEAAQFKEKCEDKLTCPEDVYKSGKDTMQKLVILLVFFVVLEGAYTAGLMSFKGTHPEDFYGAMSNGERILLILTKNAGTGLQLLWIFGLLADVYLMYVYNSNSAKCANAKTMTGEAMALYPNIQKFIVLWTLILFGTLIIGSFVRLNFPFRGELYSPAMDDERFCPAGMDCREHRDKDPPGCLPDCADSIKGRDTVSKVLAFVLMAVKFIGDKVICFVCGWYYICAVCERCWMKRHFLGP